MTTGPAVTVKDVRRVWRLCCAERVLYVLEVMHCVLLCRLEAAESVRHVLELLEVMRYVLCAGAVLKAVLHVLDVVQGRTARVEGDGSCTPCAGYREERAECAVGAGGDAQCAIIAGGCALCRSVC